MQQAIAKGDILQRVAGPSFIVGAIVSAVFNILHPRSSEATLDNILPLLQSVADAGVTFWKVDYLLLAVGIWALMIGWVGVYRSITGGPGAVWARLGFYGVIVGTALWTVLFSLEMGFGLVVEQWATSAEPAKSTWFVAAAALTRVDFLLFSMAIVVNWLAYTFLGVGMALSAPYPKWTGWSLIVLGIASVAVVGVPQVFIGLSQALTNVLFPILSILTLLWALVVGAWITRKAW
ncbi:MAG: hypothetical protein HYY31_00605 [Chloroflexi bacterium]|nr:hypothetical protein [Chloroflexota bacterium]